LVPISPVVSEEIFKNIYNDVGWQVMAKAVSEEIFKNIYNDVGWQVMAKAHMACKAMGAN
jgi:hypothetical protein